jgi:hypothetical protein
MSYSLRRGPSTPPRLSASVIFLYKTGNLCIKSLDNRVLCPSSLSVYRQCKAPDLGTSGVGSRSLHRRRTSARTCSRLLSMVSITVQGEGASVFSCRAPQINNSTAAVEDAVKITC